MYVTLEYEDWLRSNLPQSPTEWTALRGAVTRQKDVAPPYRWQDFGHDHFIIGRAAVLWLQTPEAWREFECLVTRTDLLTGASAIEHKLKPEEIDQFLDYDRQYGSMDASVDALSRFRLLMTPSSLDESVSAPGG
jgi:hypothetical protein